MAEDPRRRSANVLAVFAHPDDESLSAGGLLARTAAAGGRAAVVTPTWAPASRRADELAEALALLGAGEPRLLGYADARVVASAPGAARWVDVPVEEGVEALLPHLVELRPDVLVTHDRHGGVTGHEDHARTHEVAVRAARAAGVPRVLLATHPHSALPAIRELIGDRKAVHTVPDEEVVEALDVTPWLAAKVAAVLAHRHEVDRGAVPGLVARMTPGQRVRLLGTEWYAEG